MNISSKPGSIVVACDRDGPAAEQVRALLQARGAELDTWYALRDLDELDQAVRAGLVTNVLFARPEDLLNGVWNEDLALDDWVSHGVHVEFATAPPTAGSELTCAAWIAASWHGWNQRRRRRQRVAGVILSAIALVSAFTLVLLAT
jgi:hypothetical protein